MRERNVPSIFRGISPRDFQEARSFRASCRSQLRTCVTPPISRHEALHAATIRCAHQRAPSGQISNERIGAERSGAKRRAKPSGVGGPVSPVSLRVFSPDARRSETSIDPPSVVFVRGIRRRISRCSVSGGPAVGRKIVTQLTRIVTRGKSI